MRVLLLLTFRPEFPPPWRGRPHATLISLNRLPRRQSAALAGAVAGGRALPAAVLQRIVARADGVPLFVEELTKAVLEAGCGDTPGPDGDRHGPRPAAARRSRRRCRTASWRGWTAWPAAKEVAQIGAVIGREFGYELLAAVSAARRGRARATLWTSSSPPSWSSPTARRRTATYTFKHALVQDAAYESLLKSRRQQLHARIARELEERLPETAEAAARAARPPLRGGRPRRTRRRPTGSRPGRRRSRRSAMAEAVVHLRRALGQLTRLPEDDGRRRLELDLQITLGHALIAARGFGVPGVREAFARARQLAAAADAGPADIDAVRDRRLPQHARGEPRVAAGAAGTSCASAAAATTPAAYVEGQRRIGGAFQQLGRLVPAQRHFERGAGPLRPGSGAGAGLHRRTLFHAPHLPVPQPAAARLPRPRPGTARRGDRADAASGAPVDAGRDPALVGRCRLSSSGPRRARGWVDELAAVTAEHTLAHYTQWARVWHGWLAGATGDGRESVAQLREALSAALGRRHAALVALVHGTAGRRAQASG